METVTYDRWDAIRREQRIKEAKETPCRECEHCITGEVDGMQVGFCKWSELFLSESDLDSSIYDMCPDSVD